MRLVAKKKTAADPRQRRARDGSTISADHPAPDTQHAIPNTAGASRFTQLLANRGFRLTRQRQQVYDVLLDKRDHPTAEEVFLRSKRRMPDISVATVYNCLTALVKCGLVKQVALERGASRFCPNMREHGHFYCDACNSVFDVGLDLQTAFQLPKGFKADHFDLAVHGRCPACSKRK